jgi:tight adherence protein C
MTRISEMLNWILQNGHFGLNAISSFLFIVGVGLFGIRSSRTHAWLFQFSDAKKSFHNWVEFLVPHLDKVKFPKYRGFLKLSLGQNGSQNRSETHFMASQVVLGVAALSVSYFFFCFIWGGSVFVSFGVGFLAIALPALSLRDSSRQRVRKVHRDLPFFLDYMSLSLVAGLDFSGGLTATIENITDSPLKEELSRIQRNMMLGMSREDALLDFEDRMATEQIRGLVQTLVSSLKLGTDLANTLQTLSSSLSGKRFQMAEEEAGKISVRMMVPMICFILPVVLLLLIGPMFLSFINSGM